MSAAPDPLDAYFELCRKIEANQPSWLKQRIVQARETEAEQIAQDCQALDVTDWWWLLRRLPFLLDGVIGGLLAKYQRGEIEAIEIVEFLDAAEQLAVSQAGRFYDGCFPELIGKARAEFYAAGLKKSEEKK